MEISFSPFQLDGGSATKAVKKYDEIDPEDCDPGMGG
jgi:hypothetical protein